MLTRHCILVTLMLCLTACASVQGKAPASSNAQESFENTPTRFVDAQDCRYAYRSYGPRGGVPLVFFQHFRGSMDNWDPSLVDAIAKHRTVILFDNKGVSRSTGATPDSFRAMADDAAAFIRTLGYEQVDVLGFSIGGAVAQELALNHQALVRRLILAGTAPQGGLGLNERKPEIVALATKSVPQLEDFLTLFFEPTDHSQQLGRAFLQRRQQRKTDLDVPSSAQTMRAQAKARIDWGATPDPEFARIRRIQQPVLVANGSHDIMMPTVNSTLLFEHLPNAQLILYPDAGHGFLFQYPELFAEHVETFLRN